ncbi:PspC domain-containing protein [Marinococcus luteus]|uniref:Phage shock protein C (PspC) family protein n=1 Tax=Marinococcus luteus TaxID=1122204 RepID=A0A1H2U5T1_9BACI|nr:PspC domain-containing protein [Marinococcus luteus]MDZ5784139.1 PspC domain-containing protein [Marinococcus luteus]SDW51535.1 phage shock protein C (PspC) family protein [Marinococcus luteus]
MAKKKLYKSREDRKLTGVCGGLADYLGWDSSLIRIISVVLVILPVTSWVLLIYLVLAVLLPDEEDAVS